MVGKGEKSGKGDRPGKRVGRGVGGRCGRKRLVEGQFKWAEGNRVLAGNATNGWIVYENLEKCEEGWENDEVIVVGDKKEVNKGEKGWVRKDVDELIGEMEMEGVEEEFKKAKEEEAKREGEDRDVAMGLGDGKNTEGVGIGDLKHAVDKGKGREEERRVVKCYDPCLSRQYSQQVT